MHVHCNTLDPDEFGLLAAAGAAVSCSPETELNMGMGRLAIDACLHHGIPPTLSCDIVSLNSGDLFTQLRLAIAYQRSVDNDVAHRAGAMPERLAVRAADALRWAAPNGADALGLGAVVGSITPGKEADVIVVGGPGLAAGPVIEPEATLVFQGSTAAVRHVLVAGEFVKRDGELVGVDVAQAATRRGRVGRGDPRSHARGVPYAAAATDIRARRHRGPGRRELRRALTARGRQPMQVRRVVTGHDADGKAVFAGDEQVEPVTLALLPGMEFHRLWGSDTVASFPDDGSRPDAPRYFPPADGFRFAFFSIPPDGGAGAPADLDFDAALAEFEQKLPGMAEHLEPDGPGHAHDRLDRLRCRGVRFGRPRARRRCQGHAADRRHLRAERDPPPLVQPRPTRRPSIAVVLIGAHHDRVG